MELDMTILEADEAMTKAVEFIIHEFAAVRTGKANPQLVENLNVEVQIYGGMHMKLKQLASISTPEARVIRIEPFDSATIRDIERAFRESRLGLNPVVESKIIRVPIPELSGERRVQMVKVVKQFGEEGKVRVRGARREALETLKKGEKDGDISEDEHRRGEKEIQAITDKKVGEIDQHIASKEKEILTV